jgi:hypothetical protein
MPVTAYAQTGTIAGQVRDAQNAALPGVLVEVAGPALIEKVRSTSTDGRGRYQITALPVGRYEVKFSLDSFSTVVRGNVNVTSDFAATVNAELKIGTVQDTVTVTAEAPVVDVTNARVQQVFQGSDVAELPTQRDIPSIMLLVPSLTTASGVCSGGVGIFCNPNGPAFNSHTSALDFDGQNQGRIMVDGMVINGPRPGTGINLNTGVTNGIVLDTANVQEVSFTLSGQPRRIRDGRSGHQSRASYRRQSIRRNLLFELHRHALLRPQPGYTVVEHARYPGVQLRL